MIYLNRRLLVALCIVAALITAPRILVDAQSDDEEQVEQDINTLKVEQRRAEREAALAAAEIDVFDANVQEVTEALDELQTFVDTQSARVEAAEQAHRQATQAVETAREQTIEIEGEQQELKGRLTDLAVASFTGEQPIDGADTTELALSDDPGESARFLHLLESQTGSLADGLDRMRALEVEAEILTQAMRLAQQDAAVALAEVEETTRELDEALQLQERVVAAAEIRLEAQLAEAAVLADRGESLAIQIADEQYAINDRIAATARRNGVEIPDPVRLEDIARIEFYDEDAILVPVLDPETGLVIINPETGLVETAPISPSDGDSTNLVDLDSVSEVDPETGLVEAPLLPVDLEPVFAIEVHVGIEEQTRLLFEEAFADGVNLAGWGYRPIQRQIELRAAHCGGTEANIWHKPAFECSPPTARPGFSRHEQGRAIDFTYNGGSITSHANAGFQWLAANAPKYGFVNLASEPWHWSIVEGQERLPNQ